MREQSCKRESREKARRLISLSFRSHNKRYFWFYDRYCERKYCEIVDRGCFKCQREVVRDVRVVEEKGSKLMYVGEVTVTH